MEGRQRVVGFSGALLVLAVIWFVLATIYSLPRTTDLSPMVAPTIVTSPEGSGNWSDKCSIAVCAT